MGQVLDACVPLDWVAPPEGWKEPKAIVGCYHPLEFLRVNVTSKSVVCSVCLNALHPRLVEYRMPKEGV